MLIVLIVPCHCPCCGESLTHGSFFGLIQVVTALHRISWWWKDTEMEPGDARCPGTPSAPGHMSQPVPVWEQMSLLFPSWQPCLLTWPSVWSVGVWGAALRVLGISRRQLGSAISRKHSALRCRTLWFHSFVYYRNNQTNWSESSSSKNGGSLATKS